jgi:hypothetical protein
LKYPPFPWAQNFQDGGHQTTGAQRKIFEKGTIFFGHPVLHFCLFPKATLAFERKEICESTVTQYISLINGVSLPTD